MIWNAVKIAGIFFFCLFSVITVGQQAPAAVSFNNLPIKKLLNSTSPVKFLTALSEQLIILDFFGTWCVPCLKALPHLTNIQKEFKDEVSVFLLSNETEAHLSNFIKSRPNFSFAVIVDEDNDWNNLFQPPALPYTVVIKNGEVLAVTEAEAITSNEIKKWLAQKESLIKPGSVKPGKNNNKPMAGGAMQKSKNDLVRLSQDFIYAAKTNQSLAAISQNLSSLSQQNVAAMLTTDNEKKAFWINIYNGYTQAALKENAGQYQNRSAFFKKKNIKIGDEVFSLDDIEHGILRRSKVKWGLGHLNKLFPSAKEKLLRVNTLDYRIHFALNCGAKSCPPIAFYNNEMLDAQLDLATSTYLSSEVVFDSTNNTIQLPKLMSWFRRDFGGKKGMLKILRQYGIIAKNAKPTIKFKDYDWTLQLNNYTTENP